MWENVSEFPAACLYLNSVAGDPPVYSDGTPVTNEWYCFIEVADSYDSNKQSLDDLNTYLNACRDNVLILITKLLNACIIKQNEVQILYNLVGKDNSKCVIAKAAVLVQ